ncbi:putative signal peptide protein [Candidatus Paraburkholderia calva]|nr:putative signal peptide protein [Candidatus Paraburkholderia calva]
MNKLLIAAIVGTLATTSVFVNADAFAATTTNSSASKAKRPAPARRIIKPKAEAAAATKTNPILEGATKWSCKDGMAFYLKGNMKGDAIVTVNWAKKDYKLPRQDTTTGADRFHDSASGMDLIVIPTKAMLFSDKDESRLADECVTAEMAAGATAPTQSEALKNNLLIAPEK